MGVARADNTAYFGQPCVVHAGWYWGICCHNSYWEGRVENSLTLETAWVTFSLQLVLEGENWNVSLRSIQHPKEDPTFSCAARLAAGLFTFCETLLCTEADSVRIHGINQCQRLVLCTETCEARAVWCDIYGVEDTPRGVYMTGIFLLLQKLCKTWSGQAANVNWTQRNKGKSKPGWSRQIDASVRWCLFATPSVIVLTADWWSSACVAVYLTVRPNSRCLLHC